MTQIAAFDRVAAWTVKHHGDPHPTSFSVVRTTRARLEHELDGGRYNDPRQVYALALEGHFSVPITRLEGDPVDRGPQIVFLWDPKLGRIITGEVSPARKDLSKLGPSQSLTIP